MAGNILWQVFEFVVLLCMGLYCKCLCLFYCVSMELYGKCLCLLSYCVWNLSICCRIMYVTLWQVFVVLLCMGLYSKCLSYFCLGLYGKCAPMGSPSHGGGVSRLSLPTPFSPIFVCPSAYRNLSSVLLFTHQLLPTYLQFSSSDCPFCLHRPFTYISLLYKPSFCHFSFSLWSTRDPAR